MNILKPYLVTILSVLFVGLLKFELYNYYQIQSFLSLFFIAVSIGAWYGGFTQGMIAAALSLIFSSYFLIDPIFSWTMLNDNWSTRLVFFLIDSLVISLMCAQLRQSKTKVQSSYKNLKGIEASLRQSESRLRHAYESNMMGFIFSDKKGRVSYCNEYFAHMLGRSIEEITNPNFNWQDTLPEEYKEQNERICQLMKAGSPIQPYEREYIRPDGSRVFALVGIHQLADDEIAGFILDISERKRAEQELVNEKSRLEENIANRTKQLTEANKELSTLVKQREITAESLRDSKHFLNSVIENIPNMIFVKDAKNLRFVRFNRAGEELLGQNRVQLIGKNDYDLFPKEQADFFTQKDRDVLSGRTVVDIPEENLSTPKGHRFLHTKKIPILDKHGVPQYLLGISEDITKRKEAELQRMLLIQEQSARSVAEKTAERLTFLSEASVTLTETLDINSMLNSFVKVVIDNIADWCAIDFYEEKTNSCERIVTSSNDSLLLEKVERWLGHSQKISAPHGIIASVIKSGKACLHANIDEEILSEALRTETDVAAAMNFQIKSCMVVPLIYFDKVFGTITFVSSQSGRIYNEFDLSIAQDLAKRASFAIENANLYSKAQDANRTKSAFLANMSHEIRTPLGAMIGFAELAQEPSAETKEQNHYISTIIRNGRQLLQIVDEILDLSKVESDRIQIEMVKFNLPRLMNEVMGLLHVKANEKNLHLTMQTLPELPQYILSDPTRLRQILINVVGNAIKFTDKGSVDVTVTYKPKTEDLSHGTLEFIVADSGIGISPLQINKLFQPFVQADESMTRKFGGTGLGLFLSRKLARLLGGDLSLKSSHPGKGSQFAIALEVQVVEMIADEAEEASVKRLNNVDAINSSKTLADSSHRHGRVLIVDDAADNRTIVSIYLDKMGLDYEVAENGMQGVDKALKEKFDVILMDIQMPELDGFEAVQLLRDRNYSGPIIALTAHAMKGDKEKCLMRGFNDYLSKPLSKDSLRQTIDKYIDYQETLLH